MVVWGPPGAEIENIEICDSEPQIRLYFVNLTYTRKGNTLLRRWRKSCSKARDIVLDDRLTGTMHVTIVNRDWELGYLSI